MGYIWKALDEGYLEHPGSACMSFNGLVMTHRVPHVVAESALTEAQIRGW